MAQAETKPETPIVVELGQRPLFKYESDDCIVTVYGVLGAPELTNERVNWMLDKAKRSLVGG